MAKTKIWMLALVPLILVIGYGGVKYRQYAREWEQFEAAWLKLEAGLTGNHGYRWQPGLFSAVGEMDVSGCDVTDEKLVPLQGVTTLVKLDLSNNDVTDAGVTHLVELPRLRELDLRGTHVSDEGVQMLKVALPDCEIHR